MKRVAIIPAYNEEQTIGGVLQATRQYIDELIVIDDGSTDRTAEIARAHGATVVRHAANRGLGAAIGTGFEAAQRLGADVAVTLDADGQHDASEIPLFLKALEEGADVVIGSRMFKNSPPYQAWPERSRRRGVRGGLRGMPLHRRLAQHLANLLTFLLFGVHVTDSQSGFRALSAYALSQIEIRTNRMEVSSEIIAEAHRHGLKLVEVPIRVIYSDYSLSKGQGFVVGVKTLLKLVMRRFT